MKSFTRQIALPSSSCPAQGLNLLALLVVVVAAVGAVGAVAAVGAVRFIENTRYVGNSASLELRGKRHGEFIRLQSWFRFLIGNLKNQLPFGVMFALPRF
jgi:hypothetical protein